MRLGKLIDTIALTVAILVLLAVAIVLMSAAAPYIDRFLN